MGKLLFMGKLTISMAIFNSYVKLPEGILSEIIGDHNPSQPIGGNPGPVSFFSGRHRVLNMAHVSDPRRKGPFLDLGVTFGSKQQTLRFGHQKVRTDQQE